ncbi:MAG: carbon-nitrogen family hydrolase, partial [Ignavibacteriae bacterium]|nr:carbon-nitrogen family hydrolase [Ignavibacteriota bacterium]
HWKTLLKARAIENQCYMIGVNRIGEDPFQKYNGFSAIYDPMGKEIIISENEEKIIYAEIDIQSVYEVREKLGFLKDIKLI